jgi:acetyl esterase/lipase
VGPPVGLRGPERKGPPGGRMPFPPPKMDTSRIARKWLDLAYGNESPSQRLDLYLPDQGEGPFPVIVAIHGGAFLGGDKDEDQISPMLGGLQRGYAVASINYRLSGEAVFPALVQDCKSAVRFLRANASSYHLNPERIGAWGGSAGGYLAAMLGTSAGVSALDEPLAAELGLSCALQAVVDWCGPAEDFLRMDEEFLQSERGTPDHSQPDSPESLLMGRPITEIPERVREASPMHYVTQAVAPFLIQHGELDHVVPVQQSIGLAAAIERIAGPEKVTLEILKGVYHHGDPAFETKENLDRVFAFLDQHLLPVHMNRDGMENNREE